MDTYSYASTLQVEGGHDRVLWSVSGDDPEKVSASQVAQRMNIRMGQPHIVWNPHDGELVEMVPAGYENRSLFSARRMFSILVVANQDLAFTEYPEQHLMELLARIPEGIPDQWPMGPPTTLNLIVQTQGVGTPGHYTVDQIWPVREPVGPIDIKRLRRQA